ncbi:MAG: hypothetical protein EXS55_03460 [Candidatus Magasanikbacteria bacterium]|nr:hypothetical protein [Candidatus Magasanikbacteria bacterium]
MGALCKEHEAMNQLVRGVVFCPEGEGGWNTRLHYALDELFEFVGDVASISEVGLHWRNSALGITTTRLIKEYLGSQGLSLGMTGGVMASWVRPTSPPPRDDRYDIPRPPSLDDDKKGEEEK